MSDEANVQCTMCEVRCVMCDVRCMCDMRCMVINPAALKGRNTPTMGEAHCTNPVEDQRRSGVIVMCDIRCCCLIAHSH